MIHPSHQPEARQALTVVMLMFAVMVGVGVAPLPASLQGLPHYLVVHTGLETVGVIVAGLIFAVIWSLQEERPSRNLTWVASLYLGVAILDYSHMMSYQGMPAFITPSSPEKAIYFWLAARFLCAVAMLICALPVDAAKTSTRRTSQMSIAIVLTLVLVLHVAYFRFPDIIPRTFIPGYGLTLFKQLAEYSLIALHGVAAVLLFRRLRKPRRHGVSGLFAAACIMAQAEFFVTLYGSVTDVYNLMGHLYKLIAHWYLFRAIFVETVRRPYAEWKRTAQRIRQLSDYDHLTGLPNASRLELHFQYATAQGQPLSVLWVDLDHFKDINESMGHQTGDQLLLEVSHRLRSGLRAQDVLSRLSGDDFLALLPDTGEQDAAVQAQRLRKAVALPVTLGGQTMHPSASIGIALYPGDGEDLKSLLQKAETAMYRAKADGRNDYCFFTPEMQAQSARRLALGNALKQAIANGELRLVYQPQYCLTRNRVVDVEALLRWESAEWGPVSPAEFIPVAESGGTIVAIGKWVLETVIAQLRDWHDQGLSGFSVSLNMSVTQFSQPGLAEHIAELLDRAGVAPECLRLELTEATAMRAPDRVARRIRKLMDRGVRVVIDDFGTGYSSLGYLKRFKIYKLKIDQSFVQDISSDPDDQAIVRAIIQMAKSLGIATVAEGVETAAQWDFLEASGCDAIQGYHFSRPLEVAAFEAFMRQRRNAAASPQALTRYSGPARAAARSTA